LYKVRFFKTIIHSDVLLWCSYYASITTRHGFTVLKSSWL